MRASCRRGAVTLPEARRHRKVERLMADNWNPDLESGRIGKFKNLVQWLRALSNEELLVRVAKVNLLVQIYEEVRKQIDADVQQLRSQLIGLTAAGGEPPPEQVGRLFIRRQRLLDQFQDLGDEVGRCKWDLHHYYQEWGVRVADGMIEPTRTWFD